MGNGMGSSKSITMDESSIWESRNELRVSLGITLGNNVSGSGYKTMSIGKSMTISKTMTIGKTMSIGKRSVDDWTDWCVVDERSGGSQNFGCSSNNSGVSVSRSLAKVMPSISQTMISISNGKGVGSNFSSNLSWSFNDSFYNWNMGNCSNCGQSITQSMVSQWKSGPM